MTAQKGRDVLVSLNTTGETYVPVGGAQSITVTIANTSVDITNSDDAGIRKLLEGAGVNSISVKLAGIYIDDVYEGTIRTDAMTNAHRNYKITIPGSVSNGALTGSFEITSYEFSSAYNESAKKSLTFESAGAVSFA